MQALGSAPYSFTMLIALCWVAVFLLIGVVLRVMIPFCRKMLIPACMVGGLVGCIVVNTLPLDWMGSLKPDTLSLEMIIYHLYNLTFCCFGLAGFGAGSSKPSKALMKNTLRLPFITASITYLQTITGILLIVGYNLLFGTELLESVGILMNKGFSSGPGPAMSTGASWEQVGIPGMVSIGLAFAATGYISSIIFGVPAANYIIRKTGRKKKDEIAPINEQKGIYNEGECPPAGNMRFMVSNIDTMSFQAGLILLAYIIAFLIVTLLPIIFPFSPKAMGMIWSLFAPLFCLPAGLLVREVVVKRVFGATALFDSGCHQRLLNILVDFVAVAALIGIQIAVVREWWPIIIMGSIACSLVTILYTWVMTRKNIDFGAERFLGVLGQSTGTITSGLVLVRMIDPDYKSTVPIELGLMSIPSLLISMPLMPILMPLSFGQVYYGKSWTYPLASATVMAIVWTIVALLPFWKVNGKEAKF